MSGISRQLQQYNELWQENDSFYRAMAKAMNLPECTMWILYSLRVYQKPMTPSQLCDVMLQPKQTIHSALKKMEADGLLETLPAQDKRSRRLRLTERGIELARRTGDLVIQAEQNALDALPPQDCQQLLTLFRQYTDALHKSLQLLQEKKHADSTI